ncbi:hypothetical protein EVAR_5101_1 [Eumeta japonica]|uniref:Uncharacterized protein n=1 Tax=Eumeta variegata TaxID=151549 RepID=A0A4C1SXP6_EUMVA|nr:hypothetical protein EVAR_5101_1 [Eumeta japonica]
MERSMMGIKPQGPSLTASKRNIGSHKRHDLRELGLCIAVVIEVEPVLTALQLKLDAPLTSQRNSIETCSLPMSRRDNAKSLELRRRAFV